MKKKDLAKEYALARLQGRLSGNEVSFSENKVFTEEDIEAAFNAGRESVVENIPDLKFGYDKREGYRGVNSILGNAYYLRISDAFNPKGESSWGFSFGGENLVQWYDTKQEAEQAANEDYKRRIKQALGL
jgi:hypothetical protein